MGRRDGEAERGSFIIILSYEHSIPSGNSKTEGCTTLWRQGKVYTFVCLPMYMIRWTHYKNSVTGVWRVLRDVFRWQVHGGCYWHRMPRRHTGSLQRLGHCADWEESQLVRKQLNQELPNSVTQTRTPEYRTVLKYFRVGSVQSDTFSPLHMHRRTHTHTCTHARMHTHTHTHLIDVFLHIFHSLFCAVHWFPVL